MSVSINQMNPADDIGLFIHTIDPAWSTDFINTDFEQALFGSDGKPIIGSNGKPVIINSCWNALKFIKRDFRLGNISHKIDDFEWMENRIHLAHTLIVLRDGQFKHLAPKALAPVIAILELSQSRSGFVRKSFRTFSFKSESEDKSRKGGGFFGK